MTEAQMLKDLIGGDVKDVVHGIVTSGLIVEKDGQLYRVRSDDLCIDAVKEVEQHQ